MQRRDVIDAARSHSRPKDFLAGRAASAEKHGLESVKSGSQVRLNLTDFV